MAKTTTARKPRRKPFYGDTVWEFRTARLRVALELDRDHGYQYDGDDEDGETQSKLDSGEYVAFDSSVVVYIVNDNGDELEIGRDSLCGSVYSIDDYSEFWTAHRSSDPMNRNCTAFRARHGENCTICHYFPGMVSEAIKRAREFLPRSRGV